MPLWLQLLQGSHPLHWSGGPEITQHCTVLNSHSSLPLKGMFFLLELHLEILICWLSYASNCTSVLSLVIICYLEPGQSSIAPLIGGTKELVGLSCTDQVTGLDQHCQNSFQHQAQPHPKALICFSYSHHTHTAIHLLGKKIGVFYQTHD